MTDVQGTDRAGERLAVVATVMNVALLVALGVAFSTSQSLLALTQAADSFLDLLLSLLMVWATRLARQPQDHDHPHGHHAAEPIAALVVAVAAGVMVIELSVSAVERILTGAVVSLTPTVLGIFVSKGVLKTGLAAVALRVHRETRGPAAEAIYVDSRNDVLVSLVAVGGYFLVSQGQPAWDAWLSLPTAAWIARSGFVLARDNVAMLMGRVADDDRHREMGHVVAAVPGVLSMHGLVARHHGTHLDVTVHVVLDAALPLKAAHDIGVAVTEALEAQPDVSKVSVHLDVEHD